MTATCTDPREDRDLELALFVGGDMTADEAARTLAHLAACPACRAFVEELRESQGMLAALAGEPLDPEALARIRRAVRRRIEAEGRRPVRAPAWALALAAGLVLAVVGAAIWLRGIAPGGTGLRAVPRERVVEARPTAPLPVLVEPVVEPGTEPTTAAPEAAPEPRTPVRRAAERVAPEVHTATEPMVIQVVSDDPDIVFYWLVEPEETEDETVSS